MIYTREGPADSVTGSSVISLGTFDGVHIAHAALLERATELKERLGATFTGAWCFSSPPASAILGIRVPELTPIEEKIRLLLSFGLDFVAVGDFNDFRDVPAEDFVRSTLVSSLSCVGAVCGYDHRFGRGGKGDCDMLRTLLSDDRVVTLPRVEVDGVTVSSSEIRARLSKGDVEGACRMLGRPYAIESPVESGKRLGRRLGFPTANQLFPEGMAVLKSGVYAVRCVTEDGDSYIGTANVGVRPSIDDLIDDHKVNCETYIHGYEGDLYGRTLRIEFYKMLREEKRFSALDELQSAISANVEETKRYFTESNYERIIP